MLRYMVWRIPIIDDGIDWVEGAFKGKNKKPQRKTGFNSAEAGLSEGVPSRPPTSGASRTQQGPLPQRPPMDPRSQAPIAAPPNPMAAFGGTSGGGGGEISEELDNRLGRMEERLTMINDKVDLMQREIKSMLDQLGGSPWK